MTSAISHRGPDDEGLWFDEGAGIALGHRRLSILDLSPRGHQPMFSASGRYVIVFNGEIYNFKDLRSELERLGHAFSSQTDTEVILNAVTEWGLEAAVKRFVGMFAFALWDRKERELHLVRDRAGEKPLYYGWIGDTFSFASELKALRTHPAWKGEINRGALALLMRHNCIPAPYSIYMGIYKLLPGTIISVSSKELNVKEKSRPLTPNTYWSAKMVAEEGTANPFRGTEAEAINHLDELLRHSIRQQLVADVPVGAFLSGGVDSSTVVALMQALNGRPVKTFTIGFKESAYNESKNAKAVASHLSTDHTELYVTPTDALAVIPKLSNLYDEPFSDSSQIPTYLVSQLAKQSVTVSLSGDGGDELFAGYNRHFWMRDIQQKFGHLPLWSKKLIANFLLSVSPQKWNRFFELFSSVLSTKLKQRFPGERLHKMAEIIVAENYEGMYNGLTSHWKNPEDLIKNAVEPLTQISDKNHWPELNSFIQKMLYLDFVTYLPDDILTKVDRAAMGVSLESRMPFLDHRIIEFSWQVPMTMKIRNGHGKWVLRQVLHKYVPKDLIEQVKTGFGIPLDDWLRGPLRTWVEALLDEKRIRAEGFFNPAPVRQKWEEHLSGRRNWQYHLWDVLMFQAWLEGQQRNII